MVTNNMALILLNAFTGYSEGGYAWLLVYIIVGTKIDLQLIP